MHTILKKSASELNVKDEYHKLYANAIAKEDYALAFKILRTLETPAPETFSLQTMSAAELEQFAKTLEEQIALCAAN